MASNATHYNNLTPAQPLDKATLNKMVLRSLNLQASFNYERMQAAGWLYCILPGLVRTPMIEQRFQEAEDPKALEESYASLYPLHKMGKISDMANAIAFLSSDESGFITGEIMQVCGGSLI